MYIKQTEQIRELDWLWFSKWYWKKNINYIIIRIGISRAFQIYYYAIIIVVGSTNNISNDWTWN